MGIRYHAKERPKLVGGSEWKFEERECSLSSTSMLLVRIVVGKVADGNRLVEMLRNTPIREGEPESLEMLKADNKALGTSVVEWEKVRNGAMDYCQRIKNQHRFDGQGNFDMKGALIYDFMVGKEIIG